jgi:hypothetical protein
MVQIRGTAHPPPPSDGSRSDPADLTAAEIATTDLGGRPLLYEHDHRQKVGNCIASWEGVDGSLRIAADVTDPKTAKRIEKGDLRGLSLGTDMIRNENGDVLYRSQAELSVCGEGRRPSTWIDTVNGRTVHSKYLASNQHCARSPFWPSPCFFACAFPCSRARIAITFHTHAAQLKRKWKPRRSR